MALVGILTAIDSAIYSLSSNLSYLGANTFDVDPKGDGVQGNRRGRRSKRGESFTYDQSMEFKERFDFPVQTSISMRCTGNATIKYKDDKTNPNIYIFGIDENYLSAKGFELEYGRNFSATEALNGGYRTIIGQDIVDDLFNGEGEKAINEVISAGNIKFKVVGVLAKKGSSMNQSEDRRILIPLQSAKRYYGTPNTNYNILVAVNDATKIDQAVGEATSVLRNVRRLTAFEENDFEISKSDGLIDIIKEKYLVLPLGSYRYWSDHPFGGSYWPNEYYVGKCDGAYS